MPALSVIIPAHNEEKYIRTTLHALKNQTYQDFEVIVVTNGCTDATEDIVKKRMGKNLLHLSLPVANVSRARNFGASKASGKTLVFLDADTILDPQALQVIKEQFTEQHSVGTTKVQPDNDNVKFRYLMSLKNFIHRAGLYKGCSGILICNRTAFDTVDGYDADLKVKEHRHLIKKLRAHGDYACIDTHVTTSMRRLEQWSLLKAGTFWTKQWLKSKFGSLQDSNYETIR